jgi:hypothetical protein
MHIKFFGKLPIGRGGASIWIRSSWEIRMARSLCKWKKKEIEKDIHELAHIVDKPRFICKDCARSAHDKGFLCKAKKLPLVHPS